MSLSSATVAPPPWGRYAPTGYRRWLRRLVGLGLAHGPLKRWFYQQWLAAGPREPADIQSHGLKLRVHPWDNTIESKLLLGSRSRDREELDLLARHLPCGGAFVDIGANIGFYSLIAAARGAARVLAVEPLPTAFERLQFNIRANGFENYIVTLPAALGPERKNVTLTEVEGDLGGSSAVNSGLPGRRVDVPMLPLTDALAENGFDRLDALKIDVEGMEDAVLGPFFATAPRTLWPGFVIMEYVHQRSWREDLLAIMTRAGYAETGRNRSNVFLQLRPPP